MHEVVTLIGGGVDVNAQHGNDKMTALMWAAVAGRVEIVGVLLQEGADVNVRDSDDQTALMLAVEGREWP